MAIIEVGDLSKTFKVPVREQGLRASIRSLVHRQTREVTAVDSVSFTIEPVLIVSRWCWRRGLRRYGGASA